jgi:methylmalonyl-CoA mutase cobalamin-binding subunit
VILLGAARAEEIVSATEEEDADLVGLNVGGRIEIVERIVTALHASMPGLPIFAGGTLAPAAVSRLQELGIPAFPPGSSLASIVESARRLTNQQEGADGR